ncbi:MAG: ABC transporter transmembrane domain-containing protein, partial [Pseudomonadota bacterium]
MTAVVIDRALSNDPSASLGDQRRKQEGGAERSAPVGAVERRARESFPSILSGRRRRLFAVLLANGAAQAGAAVAFAFCVTWAGRAQDPAAIAAIVALAAGLFWLRVREIGDSTRLGLDFVAEVRLALFDGALDPGRRGGHGVAMSRMTNDLAALKNWAGYGLARSFTSVLAFSGCLAAAATMSWAYVASIAVPACLILALGWILAPRLSERVATVRAHRGRLANRLAETLLAIDLLRAHDQIARRRRLIRRRGEELNEALLNQMQAASLLRAAPDLLAPIAFVGALGLGAPIRGESVAFLLLAGLAAGPLRQALRALEHRAAFLVARERLRPGLGEPSRAHPRTRGDAREKTPQAAVQTC